jgi:carbonic anhydrase
MDRLIEGVQKFQKDVYPANREMFQRLANGQNPAAFFVACSDARVSLEWITQSGPGEMFVSRNAGNIAPPFSPADSSSGTIEYAVGGLKVEHIVVCGHIDCGAMKGLLHPEKVAHMPNVKGWLRHCEAALRAFETCGIDRDSPEALPELTKLNVRLQLDHLRTHPAVFSALRAGTLHVHGWVYGIGTGEVEAWDAGNFRWASVSEAYKNQLAANHEAMYA